MDIDFIVRNKFAVSTPHHVDKDLEYFGKTLKLNVANPETSQLFTINSEAKDLHYEKKECYNSITANILWIVKSSRTCLETAVYFKCTRLQFPTE